MKVLNTVFIVLFILSAALQYNDPDPYLWVPIYLYGALLCFLALKKRFPSLLYLLGFSFYLGYAGYLFFTDSGVLSWMQEHDSESIVQSMQATKPWIESTREFGGLLILVVALAINFFWIRKKVVPSPTGKTDQAK